MSRVRFLYWAQLTRIWLVQVVILLDHHPRVSKMPSMPSVLLFFLRLLDTADLPLVSSLICCEGWCLDCLMMHWFACLSLRSRWNADVSGRRMRHVVFTSSCYMTFTSPPILLFMLGIIHGWEFLLIVVSALCWWEMQRAFENGTRGRASPVWSWEGRERKTNL